MKSIVIVPFLFLGLVQIDPAMAQSDGASEQTVAVGRYARVRTELTSGEQDAVANPMNTVVAMTFPKETVSTVGDAISHLLMRTGYTLEQHGVSIAQERLLAFPLPESQRRLDYITVEQGLRALAGESYAPTINHVYRSISFDVRSPIDRRPDQPTVLHASKSE